MTDKNIELILNSLKANNVPLEKGLTDSEIREVEDKYSFKFPPDLKALLQTKLPLSNKFVNWRKISEKEALARLDWPYKGMCFDVEYANFWMNDFGPKPANLQEAFEVIKNYLNKAPKLIPIYSHRYLPDYPFEEGNPVFSVYQTDIVYYGSDLLDYFDNEFGILSINWIDDKEFKQIPFWSKLAE